MPLVSASLVTSPARGIKITLSTLKSVIEGQAGEAVGGGERRGRGMERRDEIAEDSGMQGR